MSLKTTGFDSARSIPEGAVLSRAYWTIPDSYSIGEVCASQEQALEFALIEARRKGIDHIAVELRWKFSYPGGGGHDAPIQRYTYSDLASADEHLARIRFYSDAKAS